LTDCRGVHAHVVTISASAVVLPTFPGSKICDEIHKQECVHGVAYCMNVHLKVTPYLNSWLQTQGSYAIATLQTMVRSSS
jgi:hypothetical protein